MLLETEEARILSQLGFTKTQTKLYLTLLKMGRTNARTLEMLTKTPRPVVYRTLDELQGKGLVEKEMAQPYLFLATPMHVALQILVIQRTEEHRRLLTEIKAFLQKFPEENEQLVQPGDYKLILISGKERIMQKIKTQLDCARYSVDLFMSLPRWLSTVEEFCETYGKALDRGVEFRIVAQRLNFKISQKVAENLLPKTNFSLKLTSNSHDTNSGIFDNEAAIINFFPSKPVSESSVIWTNHPSFITMCQTQFERAWNQQEKTNLKDNNS
jgi:sugar-specific transcriptional regulator TrmB